MKNSKNHMIKNENEISNMREAGRIVGLVLEMLEKEAKPNIKLIDLNKKAHDLIIKAGGTPIFLGFDDFPASICTSLNGAMIHGIPSENKLKEGDVLSVDVAVKYNGYSADAATTFGIGKISQEDKDIIRATKQVLSEAIEIAKAGNTLGDIGELISRRTKQLGYSISQNYAGHFIGKEMHEEPLVLNYGEKNKGIKLKVGMTLCIEPMIFTGSEEYLIDPIDGWTVYLRNGKTATHEEHTVLVGKEKGEILTKV